MRILYLTNGFPYPLTSGRLRHYFFIKELAARHEITLLSLVGPDHAVEHRQALAPLVRQMLTFPVLPRSPSFVRRNLGRVVASIRPRRDTAEAALAQAAAVCHRNKPFDVIFNAQADIPSHGLLLGLPTLTDLCDARPYIMRQRLRYARLRNMPLLALQLAATVRTERNLVARATCVTVASLRDRDLLGPHVDALVVPNGVDRDYWARTSPMLGRDQIVFTGAMDYEPNEDAALTLIQKIMPIVWRALPEARLALVGRDPSSRLPAAARSDARVVVTGWVDDVRPYLDAASVFAAPLRIGAGIQNKVLEAMSMAVPVITSPLAAAGVTPAVGVAPPVTVAEGVDAMARAIIDQLKIVRNEPKPNLALRSFIETHFTWAKVGDRLESILRDLSRR